MFIYHAVALLLDFGRGAMLDKGKNWATFFCFFTILFRSDVQNCFSERHQDMTVLLIILRAVEHFSVQPLHTICEVNWPNDS